MDLIVLLRTAEAVVCALASATPHRTVEGRKLALVTMTGAGEGSFRVLAFEGGRATKVSSMPRSSLKVQGATGRREVRSLVKCLGGTRISISRRYAACCLQRERQIGEQSVRINPRTGRSKVGNDHPGSASVHLFSGQPSSRRLLPAPPEFPPHGNPEPPGCIIQLPAHAFHRAIGRT